jgi:hypothetical protein
LLDFPRGTIEQIARYPQRPINGILHGLPGGFLPYSLGSAALGKT